MVYKAIFAKLVSAEHIYIYITFHDHISGYRRFKISVIIVKSSD